MFRENRANLATAFTLIELILVLALMALIATVTLPFISNFETSQRVGDAADEIVSLAGYARAQSIGRGVSFRLNVDPAQRRYWLTMQNGSSYENVLQDSQSAALGLPSGTTTQTQFAGPGDEMGQQFAAATGVTLTCNFQPQPDGQYVEFHPTGRCDPGTIRVADAHGKVVEIGCLSATENYHVLSDDERKLALSLQQSVIGAAAR